MSVHLLDKLAKEPPFEPSQLLLVTAPEALHPFFAMLEYSGKVIFMDRKALPKVQNYLDAREYLQDIYAHYKTENPKFSYSSWARDMGLQSKSYLRFAVLGERGLSPELVQRISEFLKLDRIETEYFTLLTIYTQCDQPEQKKVLARKLTHYLRDEIKMDEVRPVQGVLANPLAITIRNILSFSDIPRTTEFLMSLLAISEEEMTTALMALQGENLITFDGKSWTATQNSIKVSNQTNGETLEYHKQCLLKAIEAQAKPADERHFRSVGLAMSKEEYQNYLQDLDQFVKSTFGKYNQEELINRRVYQINFNLFAWTPTVNVN